MRRTGAEYPGAESFVPTLHTLPVLAAAAKQCRGCPLYQHATQTVFGEGPFSAKLFLIGEQPGNEEDLQGRPFVGPAGKILDKALREAGIDRAEIYVTNVVKHFKFEERGKRRIHKKPAAAEIHACEPWLTAEMQAVHAKAIVCLGATAAQSLLGSQFKLTQHRGEIMNWRANFMLIATIHPSAILRVPNEEQRHEEYRGLVLDLIKLRERL